MKRSRLGALGALCAVIAVGAAAGVAPAATSPTATATKALVAGSPSSIACGGYVDARITVNGQAGTTGTSTDVMLVLDLSGSMVTPTSKFTELKSAARSTLAALDAADGTTNQAISGNAVGIVYYRNSSATIAAAIGTSYATLLTTINTLPTPAGSSPHNLGIDRALSGLGASSTGYARSMVLVTDAQTATTTEYNAATSSATTAKNAGVRVVPVGIGTDVSQSNLETWASQPSYYQSGTPGPISTSKLLADLGAAVSVPVSFTVTETLGPNFSATPQAPSTGTVTTGAGTLQWTGTIAGTGTTTLDYRATRNGSDVFASAAEVVSTTSLAVTGGTATVTPPAAASITVLPCGATPIASTTCTGSSCTTSGTQGGTAYTVDAGAPPAGTSVVLAGLNATPPAGTCPRFTPHTAGAQIDIRPLAANSTLQMTIPRAALGPQRWYQVDVCLGTNMRFTTAINPPANLSQDAVFVSGGALPGRWWGILPSTQQLAFFPGHGYVLGPYVVSRSQKANGDAVIVFRVPYIPDSSDLTTDGKPGYDPKFWG